MKIATRLIRMKRGDLFQIARDMQHLLPADPAHAERFRRICSVIRNENQKLLKPHEREVEEAKKAIPVDDRSDEKFREVTKEVASKPVEIRVDSMDLKVFTKAILGTYTSPVVDAQGRTLGGQAFNNLQLLHEDLVALGVWDVWKLSERLIVDADKDALEKEFPSDALELDDESLDAEFADDTPVPSEA